MQTEAMGADEVARQSAIEKSGVLFQRDPKELLREMLCIAQKMAGFELTEEQANRTAHGLSNLFVAYANSAVEACVNIVEQHLAALSDQPADDLTFGGKIALEKVRNILASK